MRPLVFLAWLAASAGFAEACTTVARLDPGRPVVAYNFDFAIGQGLVLINKRGFAKTSETETSPARWTSRFGSVTFTQFGRDSPMTGMNEAGLVITQMWLDEARYEPADGRATVGVLEWLQYLLDTSASVDEALANAAKVRIASRIPIHYALADAGGKAAVVEFLDGEPVIRKGTDLPIAALANSTYAASLSYAEQLGTGEVPAGTASLTRFARAAQSFARAPSTPDPIAQAFATLNAVAQPGYTQWSIVYDPANVTVRWRTQDNIEMRSATLSQFDLSCTTPVRLLDIKAGSGDMTASFREYRTEDNEILVTSSVAGTPFLSSIGRDEALASARWPDRSVCAPAPEQKEGSQ